MREGDRDAWLSLGTDGENVYGSRYEMVSRDFQAWSSNGYYEQEKGGNQFMNKNQIMKLNKKGEIGPNVKTTYTQ